MIEFDAREVERLEADLTKSALHAPRLVEPVVEDAATAIEKAWKNRWRGLRSAPSLPDAVTHETKATVAGTEAEIGPDKSRRQGALGNIIEFGTRNNAPIPGGGPALKAEEPKFVKALGDMLEDAIGGSA